MATISNQEKKQMLESLINRLSSVLPYVKTYDDTNQNILDTQEGYIIKDKKTGKEEIRTFCPLDDPSYTEERLKEITWTPTIIKSNIQKLPDIKTYYEKNIIGMLETLAIETINDPKYDDQRPQSGEYAGIRFRSAKKFPIENFNLEEIKTYFNSIMLSGDWLTEYIDNGKLLRVLKRMRELLENENT